TFLRKKVFFLNFLPEAVLHTDLADGMEGAAKNRERKGEGTSLSRLLPPLECFCTVRKNNPLFLLVEVPCLFTKEKNSIRLLAKLIEPNGHGPLPATVSGGEKKRHN